MATPPESLSPAAAAVEDDWEEARGLLYEAYNELQGLAAELGGAAAPAPAVVVVGHQTDGKSALVEALMGFQFNHVGGGTKTRRPVALHLRFNPRCHVPRCRLLAGSGAGDDEDEEAGVAGRAMPLADIQAYIEAENMRLENDPSQFSEKEIIIRIEYKHCPNLTIIDTPGLILPAPGRKNRVLQSQACAVETLVRAKIKHKETIILCLEDCSDWSNATTRRVVMQVDPDLARTVLVSTKLDTKILQFARASDVEVFLHPPTCVLDGSLLGGYPFFTSVPSGRVGSCHEAVFRSNEEFKKAISLRELEDVASLEDKLGRGLTKEEKNRIGVSNLRLFLEELLRKRNIVVQQGSCVKSIKKSVTCIQFNPVDDRFFISGSLDAKVRLWSIPDRQVVDWTDLNEMVTAASYTPDGQGAIIGSHKGSCRFYKTTDCKLDQEAQIDIETKKRKSQAKKITGFQFAPGNPSEVLVTSADSQIRVFDGVTMVQKFRGFKNTSSQISAAYTSDGRYVVCPSEDSHVYLSPSRRQGGVSCTDDVCSMPAKSGELGSSGTPLTHSGQLGSPAPGGGKGGGAGADGNAWGLVVVTASLQGEIRVYQNFGMPFRIRGQELRTKMKEKARLFHDSFLSKLSLLLKGMVVAPPDRFGETLINERINGGTFTGSENFLIPNKLMPNAGMRLYGGAQYHRAMAEFRLIVGSIKCPPITREEIVNACGVEDIHDGTNYSRTACVLAVAKARDTFEPYLHQLGFRLLYIMKRLIPISAFLLEKDGENCSSHDVLVKRVKAAFDRFAESTEQSCRERCMEDLVSTTRYVTWSLHNKNRAGLRHFFDSFVAQEQLSVNTLTAHSTGLHEQSSGLNDNKQDRPKGDFKSSNSSESNSPTVASETRLVDLLDSTLWNRRLAPSSERLVYALVHQIFHGIKEHFLVTTELKFNCFLLMPIVDKLPALLREDLESAFEDDLDSIFDVTQLRHSLGQRKRDLEIELKRIKRLKEKFAEINKKLNSLQVRQ
uniref:Dynamin-type G domain-containing protein n=1 Tax=Oryza glumipatula TaxID=40148 RepID=A0A0E0BPS6_9ORYZ